MYSDLALLINFLLIILASCFDNCNNNKVQNIILRSMSFKMEMWTGNGSAESVAFLVGKILIWAVSDRTRWVSLLWSQHSVILGHFYGHLLKIQIFTCFSIYFLLFWLLFANINIRTLFQICELLFKLEFSRVN